MEKKNAKDITYDDVAGVGVRDSSGNVTVVPYSKAVEQGLVTSGMGLANADNVTAYKNASGEYTRDASQAVFPTSISLDTSTGNVKIDAPKVYFNTQSYKEKVKPVLETISQNYKLNSDYKYALLNGNNETKTSEEWVKDIEKDLPQYVSDAMQFQAIKDETKQKTGLDLTDEQVIKMSSVAIDRQQDGSVIKVSDDTVQSLPEVIKNLAAFKNLQGWQNGEVTYKNLMESWNRENTSDEDILQVYDSVSDYFNRGEYKDADEYAEMVAFAQFIESQHPETGFWRGVGDWISNAFVGIVTGAAEFDVGLASLLEGARNAIAPDYKGPISGTNTFVKDYLQPELESWEKNFQTNSMRLNEAAGTMGAILNGITPIAMQLVVGNALGRAAATGVKAAASSAIARTGSAAALAAEKGMTAEQVATSALNGTNFLMRIMSAEKANTVIASAVNSLKSMQNISSTAATLADLGAQIIVDVAVTDNKLTRQLLDGNVSDEVKQYVLEQVALDAGGWGLAAGTIKVVKAAGKTDTGKVINAALAPRIGKWTARIGDYTDTIKTNTLHGGDANWNKTKADKISARIEAMRPEGWKRTRLENKMGAAQRRQQNLTARRTERIANRNIGKLSGELTKGADSWSDMVENANRIKREMDIQFVAAHNLADRVYKGDVQARVTRIKQEFDKLSSAMDEYTQQLTRVLRAEDVAGLKRGTKAIDVGDSRSLSMISKESNEYVVGSYRLRLGEDTKPVLEKRGESTAGVQKEIDYYTKKTKDFREAHPELAAQLDKLGALGMKLSAATQDARVFEDVLDEGTLLARRNSPEFRRGYMRTQRLKEWENYQKRGGELRIPELRDDQHLRWGFEGDAPDEYQDITFTLFDDINQVAKQSIRKEEIGYLEILGEKVEVMASGEEVKMAKEVNRLKDRAIKDIDVNTSKFVGQMDDDIFNEVFEYKEAKSKIMTAEADAMDQGAKVSRATVKPIKMSNLAIRKMVRSGDNALFGDDVMAAIIETKYGKGFIDFTEEEWDKFVSEAPRGLREMISAETRENARMATEFGDLNKKDLPKIRTSDYTAATGLKRKEAPAWLQPYLSEKNGKPMDLVLDTIDGGERFWNVSNPDDAYNAWTDVSNLYERVLNRTTLSGTSYDALQGLLYKELENGEKVLSVKGEQFLAKLNREAIARNYDDLWGVDNYIRETAEDIVREKAVFDAETLYAENIRALEAIKKEYDIKDMAVDLNQDMDAIIDMFIANNAENEVVSGALRAMSDNYEIIEYATLNSLTEKKNLKRTADKLESLARKRYNEILTANNKVVKDGETINKLTGEQIKKASGAWARQTKDWFEERVNQRYGEAVSRLREIDPEIVDYKTLFGRVEDINRQITESSTAADVVKTYDDVGREEYVRLSPTIAEMITTMPTPLRRGGFGTIQDEFVKVFRAGTTGGLVPASLFRQGLRDPGLAFTSGGATMSNATIERQLNKVYGSTIAEYYQEHVPDVWATLLEKAEGDTVRATEMAVSKEMGRAKAYASDQVQSKMYQFTRQQRAARNADGIYDSSVFSDMRVKVEDAFMKTEKLNNMRESGLRVWTYRNAYLQALNNGHSVPMARKYAEAIQAEATTNFSRQTYHLANLSHTVPYLGAAINGYKSFWRLYALDPVGVTTRIVGGYVVPLIALTGLSLGTEENRIVYKQIPEYEKDDNLVFVINGQKFSIPIPQEVSTLVRPIQSWIETMQGANDHSIDELMANNLAGFFPYDLQGFVNIDSDRILANNEQEDIWENHLLPGFSVLSSQMMAPLVKSGVMYATGYDPYTRKKIETAYTTTDPITGESIVVDYKSGELAKAIGNIFKGNFGVSAQMAQAILNNILGSNNTMIIDGLSDLAASVPTEEGIGAGATKLAERVAESMSKPFSIPDYGEQSNLAWNRAVRQLYDEKNAIMTDPEYIADLKMIAEGRGTEEANNKALSRIKTKKEEFQEKVLRATKNLVQEYDGGTLDRNKFASVLSLMTFNDGNNQDPTNPLSKLYNREDYNLARAQAIETMAAMGFDSPNDYSIFGYYGADKDTGEISFQMYSPLAILNYEYSSRLQPDISYANIKAAVDDAKLWDAHDSIEKQVQKIYNSKKKLTNSDYDAIDAIYINWNSQVAKTIAPYVSNMTPEAAINNTDVLNYLYPLIEVPNNWEVNNKGRYVSLGDRGNKKRAYYESWIKSMYGIKDKYKGQY